MPLAMSPELIWTPNPESLALIYIYIYVCMYVCMCIYICICANFMYHMHQETTARIQQGPITRGPQFNPMARDDKLSLSAILVSFFKEGAWNNLEGPTTCITLCVHIYVYIGKSAEVFGPETIQTMAFDTLYHHIWVLGLCLFLQSLDILDSQR